MNEWEWTPEQQAIIDRIKSGQTDFTFGPGSPNPTHEDLHTYVGGKFSPAGGFAVDGGVALAPKEYNMFTPEQRRALGIMDIAPKNQVGKIERYYGWDGMSSSQFASNNVPSPITGGSYAGLNVIASPGQRVWNAGSGVPDTMGTGRSATGSGVQAVGGVIGNALQQYGQQQARQGQIGMQQALAMLQQRRSNPSAYAPLPFPSIYG